MVTQFQPGDHLDYSAAPTTRASQRVRTPRIPSETRREGSLRTLQHTLPECLTAFRLPKDLLETLNEICAELYCNRSQLIRRSLKEFIAFHELDRRKQDFHSDQLLRQRANVQWKQGYNHQRGTSAAKRCSIFIP